MCIGTLPAYISLHHTCTYKVQKRVLSPWNWSNRCHELLAWSNGVMSCHVDAGKKPCPLWEHQLLFSSEASLQPPYLKTVHLPCDNDFIKGSCRDQDHTLFYSPSPKTSMANGILFRVKYLWSEEIYLILWYQYTIACKTTKKLWPVLYSS